MLKRLTIFFFFVAVAFPAFSQQNPMFTQYIFDGLLINPAYAGTREALTATVLYRDQWVGIPGAPKTGVFSIDSPISNMKVGLGLNVVADKIGITNTQAITGIYSYQIYFSQSALSFGLQAGVAFYNSNNTDVIYSEDQQVDPAFLTDYHRVLPNFSFGSYYHTQRFFAGLSVMNILGKTIQNQFYPNMESDFGINAVSHIFLTSGYLFDLSANTKFQTSLLFKYVSGAPLEIDGTAVVMLHDLIAFGFSYRSYASVNFLTEVRLNSRLKLGYSYEYSTNELSNFTSGSHEIVLRYQFSNGSRRFVSPRYF